MDGCIFCKIINKEIPAAVVYEDDKVLVFKDISPAAPVHVLVIPKVHISGMNEISPENAQIFSDVLIAAKKIAGLTGIDKSGYRLINNCGADAGQTVQHLHFHILGGVDMGTRLI